jgi:hypothetical protein
MSLWAQLIMSRMIERYQVPRTKGNTS